MRVLVGLLVLLGLFASAAAWQGRLTRDSRKRHDHQVGAPENSRVAVAEGQTLQAGWNTLVIGRPSGAEPFFDPEAEEARRRGNARAAGARRAGPGAGPGPGGRARGRTPEAGPPDDAAELPPLPRYEPDFEIVVRPGDVLSKICQGHYRTRPDGIALHKIVEAVGRYNGLASADDLRADTVLRLPDVKRFLGPDAGDAPGAADE